MAAPGYVYVLWNPAMGDLLKIGRTTRNPDGRAAELSASTAVPTPFLLAYYTETSDCDELERVVHQRLGSLGHRYAANREFFDAPLHLAMKVRVDAALELDTVGTVRLNFGPESNEPLWKAVEAEADAEFDGRNTDLPPDREKARRLYERAATFGSSRGFRRLAEMEFRGEGGPPGSCCSWLRCLRRSLRTWGRIDQTSHLRDERHG